MFVLVLPSTSSKAWTRSWPPADANLIRKELVIGQRYRGAGWLCDSPLTLTAQLDQLNTLRGRHLKAFAGNLSEQMDAGCRRSPDFSELLVQPVKQFRDPYFVRVRGKMRVFYVTEVRVVMSLLLGFHVSPKRWYVFTEARLIHSIPL